mgnify:CR=1 FL=1
MQVHAQRLQDGFPTERVGIGVELGSAMAVVVGLIVGVLKKVIRCYRKHQCPIPLLFSMSCAVGNGQAR